MACDPLKSLPLVVQNYAGYCGIVGYNFTDQVRNAVAICGGGPANPSPTDACVLLASAQNTIFTSFSGHNRTTGTGGWTTCLETTLNEQGAELFGTGILIDTFCIEPSGGYIDPRPIYGWTPQMDIGIGAAGGAIIMIVLLSLLFAVMKCCAGCSRRKAAKSGAVGGRNDSWLVRQATGLGVGVGVERGWQHFQPHVPRDVEADAAARVGLFKDERNSFTPYSGLSPDPYRGVSPGRILGGTNDGLGLTIDYNKKLPDGPLGS